MKARHESIRALAGRSRSYYVADDGLIGIHEHGARGPVSWFRYDWNLCFYERTGETKTPCRARRFAL
jgi:hypothetical protein